MAIPVSNVLLPSVPLAEPPPIRYGQRNSGADFDFGYSVFFAAASSTRIFGLDTNGISGNRHTIRVSNHSGNRISGEDFNASLRTTIGASSSDYIGANDSNVWITDTAALRSSPQDVGYSAFTHTGAYASNRTIEPIVGSTASFSYAQPDIEGNKFYAPITLFDSSATNVTGRQIRVFNILNGNEITAERITLEAGTEIVFAVLVIPEKNIVLADYGQRLHAYNLTSRARQSGDDIDVDFSTGLFKTADNIFTINNNSATAYHRR